MPISCNAALWLEARFLLLLSYFPRRTGVQCGSIAFPIIDSRGDWPMRKALVGVAALLFAAGPALAQQKPVKIGFVSTFSGPTAVIGNDMKNSFELALDHLGRTMGGLPAEGIY